MSKMPITPRLWVIVLLSLACGGLLTALACRESEPPAAALAKDRLSDLESAERGTVEVFQRVSAAVVNVSTAARARSFFSLDVFEIPQGSGTGFVWDKRGHIVTNYHVIHDVARGRGVVNVTFADQTTRRAKVVGAYPHKDLAVLSIDLPAEKLTPVVPGTSGDLLVGQTVLAIGNPFGLDHTLTTGVVSALGREIKSLTGRPIQDMIQTDAAINSGNSGGPLLDSRGRLIGVNTAIFSPSGASAGIGFAIPIDTVKLIVTQLIEHGQVVRPVLGVELFRERVAEMIAQRQGIEGVIIAGVPERSAAARAGLRGAEVTEDGDVVVNDVITGIDGKKVRNREEIYRILDRHQIGDEVEVTFLRKGLERKTRIKLQSVADPE